MSDIQDMLNSGNSVMLGPGVYELPDTVFIPQHRQLLCGSGPGKTILKCTGTQMYALQAQKKNGVGICNLTLDVNSSNRQLTSRTFGILYGGCNLAFIENVEVMNTLGGPAVTGPASRAGGVGINLSTCTSCVVTNCNLHDLGTLLLPSDGIYVGGGSYNQITECKASKVTDTAYVSERGNYTLIRKNTATDCSSGAAITVAGNSDIFGNIIDDLQIVNWKAGVTGAVCIGCVTFDGLGSMWDTILNNIRISGTNYGPGINCIQRGKAYIYDLTVSNCNINGTTLQGMLFAGTNGLTVNNNIIQNTGFTGVEIKPPGTKTFIIDNQIWKPVKGDGISFDAEKAPISLKDSLVFKNEFIGFGVSKPVVVYPNSLIGLTVL